MGLPVPGEYPERLGELEVQVHEKEIPGRFPVSAIIAVSPEQIIKAEVVFVTTGTGRKISLTVSFSAGQGKYPVAVRISFTDPEEISEAPAV